MSVSRRARGFSLVELLVASAIGSVLIALTLMLWHAGVAAQRLGEARLQVHDQGVHALQLLAREIHQAGFVQPVALRSGVLRAPLPYALLGCAGRRFGSGSGTVNALRWQTPVDCAAPVAGNNSDALVVVYESGDPAGLLAHGAGELFQPNAARPFGGTCQGNRPPWVAYRSNGDRERLPANWDATAPLDAAILVVGGLVQNHYYVDTTPRPGLNGGRLMCAGVGISGELEAPQPLVQGVEAMRLAFGVDTDGDGVLDTYLGAADVPADQWGRVVSVQLCLVMRSEALGGTTAPPGGTSDCAGQFATIASGAQVRVLRATVALRNRGEGAS